MSKRTLAALAVTTTTIIWGSTFITIKLVLTEVPPFTLALLRFAIASLILLPAIHLNPAWRVNKRSIHWARMAAMGFSGVCLYFIAENLGMVYTTASNGSLVTAGAPAVTAIFAVIFLKERLGWVRSLGIAVSILGVAVIVLAGGEADSRSPDPLLGNLLICGANVCWAAYTIWGKRMNSLFPDIVVTAYTIALGTVFLLPFAGYEWLTTGLGSISFQSWLIVVFLGTAASAGAYVFWNYALTHLEASVTSTFLNLVPVVSLLLAAGLLGERILPIQIVGGVLVMGGVYLASRISVLEEPATVPAELGESAAG
jgi:drug/metabolite transporter (DMT)-like permease